MRQYERSESIQKGGVVVTVADNSPAKRAGVHPGDTIVAVDGHAISDMLDWMWYADAEQVELTVRDEQGIERGVIMTDEDGDDWGIEFQDFLFDGIKRCTNACAFCFMHQLPKGMRESLYLRDDDFRLSFTQGNFVTLTNLSSADVDRIIEQRLAPLYVSFHAADPEVRQLLIGKNHQIGLDNFAKIARAGIELHVQIVLVPGVNDGVVLDGTLAYLNEFRPSVSTVGIVPVAYTVHTKDIAGKEPVSFTDSLSAAKVIEQVQAYQFKSRAGQLHATNPHAEEYQAEAKETWVHLADEFYINAQAPFPTTEWYDGFEQYENGIGIVWGFVNDIKESFDELTSAFATLPEDSDAITFVVGELATDTWLGTLSALRAGGRARLLPVKNRFFGGNVSVTGLLTAQDIAAAVNFDAQRVSKPTLYVIPGSIFNHDDVTLDDVHRDTMQNLVNAPLYISAGDPQSIINATKAAVALIEADGNNATSRPLKEI